MIDAVGFALILLATVIYFAHLCHSERSGSDTFRKMFWWGVGCMFLSCSFSIVRSVSVPVQNNRANSPPVNSVSPAQEDPVQTAPPPVTLEEAELHYAKLERQALNNGWDYLGIENINLRPPNRDGWFLIPMNLALMEGGLVSLEANPTITYEICDSEGKRFSRDYFSSNNRTISGQHSLFWVLCRPKTEPLNWSGQGAEIKAFASPPEDEKGTWLRLERRFDKAETATVCSLPGTINGHELKYDVYVAIVPPLELHSRFAVGSEAQARQIKSIWDRGQKKSRLPHPRFPERLRRQRPPMLTVTTGGVSHSIVMPFFSKTVTSDELWRGLRSEFIKADKEPAWNGNGELSIECQMPSTVHVVIRSRWPE